MSENTKPSPGSDEAIAQGCKCPVLDNGHGKGSGRAIDGRPVVFWINVECPIHNLTDVALVLEGDTA
jgi:hypothetical protein